MSRSAARTRTSSHEGHGETATKIPARRSRNQSRAVMKILCFPVARFLVNVVAVMVAMGGVAEGQDEFKQTIVVTAADTPVALGSVTRTLTVITREQIAQLPVHSIADVLRLASSVDVRARGERGIQTDFAV